MRANGQPAEVDTSSVIVPIVAATAIAVVHLFAGRVRGLHGVPRSSWLSAAGGVSVAYVFVHLLPELAEYQEAVGEAAPAALAFLERHVYLLALVGLAAFYGIELSSRAARDEPARPGRERNAALYALLLYAAYNGVIGYLIARREGSLVLFAIAMGLHFVVNDHGLRETHGRAYHRYGRWLVSVAVVAGAVVGVLTSIPEGALGLLVAFVGGGIILNVLKEELPQDRRSRFGAFAAGAAAYAVVLLAV